MNPKYAKQARYRAKMKAQGRCECCGKPCAPYWACAARRAYKNFKCAILRGGYIDAMKPDFAPEYSAPMHALSPLELLIMQEEQQAV